MAFPTGDQQAKIVAKHQPVTLAGMEGHFHTGAGVELNIIGQPDVDKQRLDNPLYVPDALSFLAFGHFNSSVQGLDAFPKDTWPTNIALLYYSFHIMAGLGTMFILLMILANIQRWRGRLEQSRGLLWVLMLFFPFPYIATTAGWMTAELGRQPLAHLQSFSHHPGRQRGGERGKCIVHPDGFHRTLFCARRALSVYGRTGNCPRTTGNFCPRQTGGFP